MTQDDAIILALKVVLISGIVSVALFTGVYSYLARWQRDPVGRTVVILDIFLGCALIPTTLSLFFQFSRLTSHVAAWIDVGLFGLISIGMLQRIPTWVRLHQTHGQRTYRGLPSFAAEVIRRRGRPVWAGPADPADEGEPRDGGDESGSEDEGAQHGKPPIVEGERPNGLR